MHLYLDPAEYAAYGLPEGTAAASVALASQVADGFLGRPEGLLTDGSVMLKTAAPLSLLAQPSQRGVLLLPVRPVVAVLSVSYRSGGAWAGVGGQSFDEASGCLWLTGLPPCPAEVRVRYCAGWTLAGLPVQIKQAVARIVLRAQALVATYGSSVAAPVSSIQLAEMSVSAARTAGTEEDSLLDADAIRLLMPYRRKY